MFRSLFGVFLILHGLVHVWYIVLSQRLVDYQPTMGWTGESWLLSGTLGDAPTRALASVLFALSTLGFVVSGVAVLARAEWWRPITMGAAALSVATLVLLWDGDAQMLVQKGVLGVLISIAVFLFALWGGL